MARETGEADDDLPNETTQLIFDKSVRRRPSYKGVGLSDGIDTEAGSSYSPPSRRSTPGINTQSLGQSNGGRSSTSDFATIDGLHDLCRDALRSRTLYSRRGFEAKVNQAFDAASGWLAVALMGAVTASVAFLVDVSVVTVSSWKSGYCKEGWWRGRHSCCALTSSVTVQKMALDRLPVEVCNNWISWSNDYSTTYLVYVAFALLFGIVSGSVTLLTKKTISDIPAPEQPKMSPLPTYTTDDIGEIDDDMSGLPRSDISLELAAESGKANGRVIYMAAGSGIPEIKTIISGFTIPNYLDLKVLIVKAVGSVFAVSTGMCLGKEGPFVHIGTCVAYLVANRLPKYRDNGRKLRELLSAGCASGLCVAFGAPIGGVLFSLEEISTHFPRKTLLRTFLCSLVAAAILQFLNPTGTGKLILFETKYNTIYSPRHYLVFVTLGIAGGIFGGVFCKLNFVWSKAFRSFAIIKHYPVLEVIVIVLVTALLQFPNPVTREPGDVIIERLLIDCRNSENMAAWVCVHESGHREKNVYYKAWLIYGMLIKLFLTIITFGVKVPSGIIIPALNGGAFFGRLLGQFAIISGDLQPGIFAMVGAVAFLAGVSRVTISLAVIMFELTGESQYIVPNMISILAAKWVADAIEPEGVYDLTQTLLGLPFLDGEVAQKVAVCEGALVDETISPGQGLDKLSVEVPTSGLLNLRLLTSRLNLVKRNQTKNAGLVLVRGETFIGYLTEAELERGVGVSPSPAMNWYTDSKCRVASELPGQSATLESFDIDLTHVVHRKPLTVVCGSPMELAVELFSKLGLGYLCLTDEKSGKVCAVVTKKNLLDWLDGRKNE